MILKFVTFVERMCWQMPDVVSALVYSFLYNVGVALVCPTGTF